jgi:hypothetical protein
MQVHRVAIVFVMPETRATPRRASVINSPARLILTELVAKEKSPADFSAGLLTRFDADRLTQ